MRIVDNTTVELTATYTEPTTDQDNTPLVSTDNPPLTDLAYTNVYYKFGANPPVKGPQVPASAPAGGGAKTATLLVPAAAGVKTTLDFWVTATDLSGNEGAQSAHVSFVVDRVGPSAPTNFSIA